MQPRNRSIRTRRSTVPTYYQGRPAHLWIAIPGARRTRAATRQAAERASDAREAT
jgi:hypothetical protein